MIAYADEGYFPVRPKLAIPAAKVLPLDSYAALNGKLTGLKSLFEGHLAVIQGVGYPNPNRSHFGSTEIWQTGSDADQIETRGWLDR